VAISLDLRRNQLLPALPDAERQRWLPQLEWVELPRGHVLYESSSTLSHVYFPTTAVVSLLYVMETASRPRSPSSATGLRRIALVVGGESTPCRAVVQSAGQAFG
jgi:hypothetical protein